MKTRKRIITGTLAIAAVAILTAGLICIPHLTTYAGGTVTVDVANQGEWPEGTAFNFDLYKVGDYTHDAKGLAVFRLDASLEDSGVAPTLADAASYEQGETPDTDFSQKWLNTANTLATYLNGMADKPEAAAAATADFGSGSDASFNMTVADNGLYLLVGRAAEVGDTLWTPQPMFVSVLNGDKTISFNNSLGVKMTSRSIVGSHNVIKQWAGDEDEQDLVRPDKIAVKILYGQTEVSTVTLSKDSGYKFDWTHKVHYASGGDAASSDDDTVASIDFNYEDADGNKQTLNFVPADGDAGWSVVEVRSAGDVENADKVLDAETIGDLPWLRYYTTTYETRDISADVESFVVTNTLEYKSLELTKKIDGYDADGQNVTFSFLVEGRKDASDEEPSYTNHIGVTFSADDALTETVRLDYIPSDITDIRITEEYSGNYVMDGDPVIEFDETENIWKVTVNNKHDGHGPKGGIVNVYNHGSDEPVQAD